MYQPSEIARLAVMRMDEDKALTVAKAVSMVLKNLRMQWSRKKQELAKTAVKDILECREAFKTLQDEKDTI